MEFNPDDAPPGFRAVPCPEARGPFPVCRVRAADGTEIACAMERPDGGECALDVRSAHCYAGVRPDGQHAVFVEAGYGNEEEA